MPDTQKKEGSKDGLALIVGGLFILALVFATYNYFSKGSKDISVNLPEETALPSGSASQGDLNGSGATSDNSALGTGGSTGGPNTTAWTPNIYNKGDITGNSYTVVYGDTLWEISIGAYGDGTKWTQILDANKASIGMLPSGEQALIFPNQVLVLP